jgi:serpin B
MQRFVCVLVVVGLLGWGVASGTGRGAAAAAVSAQPAVEATNRVAVALLQSLDGGGGNDVFSPYSIQSALAMAYQGAAGKTATEIGRVLNAPDAVALGLAEAKLSGALSAATAGSSGSDTVPSDAPRLDIANGLWVQSRLPLEPSFSGSLASDFGAAPQTVDFASAAEVARGQINSWVADRTAQRIKNVMPVGSVTAQTSLVLANALFLKAHWASPFVRSMTARRPFFPAAGREERVPFMTQPAAQFGYASGAGYQAVGLPYLDSDLSMLVVMPTGPLAAFERALTPARLARIAGSLQTRLVDLSMPRLHLTVHAQLNATLARLGMPTAFTDLADFSGISKARALKIQAADHGADLLVDEQGTIAAAATGISMMPTSALLGPVIRLAVDHPFLAVIRDDRSGAILFAARVADPSRG